MNTIAAEPTRLYRLLTRRDQLNQAIAREMREQQRHNRAIATGSNRYVLTRTEWTTQIIVTAAMQYDVSVEEIRDGGRDAVIAEARHVAFWLLRQSGRSFPEIGRHFDCHHTTVLHGVKRVEGDPVLVRTARAIFRALTEGEDDE